MNEKRGSGLPQCSDEILKRDGYLGSADPIKGHNCEKKAA